METKDVLSRTNCPETADVYEAPVIETIDVKVEQGFNLSHLDGNPNEDNDGGGSW